MKSIFNLSLHNRFDMDINNDTNIWRVLKDSLNNTKFLDFDIQIIYRLMTSGEQVSKLLNTLESDTENSQGVCFVRSVPVNFLYLRTKFNVLEQNYRQILLSLWYRYRNNNNLQFQNSKGWNKAIFIGHIHIKLFL